MTLNTHENPSRFHWRICRRIAILSLECAKRAYKSEPDLDREIAEHVRVSGRVKSKEFHRFNNYICIYLILISSFDIIFHSIHGTRAEDNTFQMRIADQNFGQLHYSAKITAQIQSVNFETRIYVCGQEIWDVLSLQFKGFVHETITICWLFTILCRGLNWPLTSQNEISFTSYVMTGHAI